jgi:hypothetical protein
MQLIVSVLLELRVLEYLVGTPLPFRFVEVIHIKLPNKRGEIVVFKVDWEHLFREFGLINNHEGESIICPLHGFLHARFTKDLKNFH